MYPKRPEKIVLTIPKYYSESRNILVARQNEHRQYLLYHQPSRKNLNLSDKCIPCGSTSIGILPDTTVLLAMPESVMVRCALAKEMQIIRKTMIIIRSTTTKEQLDPVKIKPGYWVGNVKSLMTLCIVPHYAIWRSDLVFQKLIKNLSIPAKISSCFTFLSTFLFD